MDSAGIDTELESIVTNKLDPTGAIDEPHVLTTKQLNPVICKPSEKENVVDVVSDSGPEEPVDPELEEWVAETRKTRGAALDLPTVMQACPEFASWAHTMGGVSEGLERSAPRCNATQTDDRSV